MVSTQSNPGRPIRRPKSKMRIKRTKRRIGRRIGTTPSGSKSSLDNLEAVPSTVQLDRKSAEHEPATFKKRSLSEERPPSRVKIEQRSSSMQLESAFTRKSLNLNACAFQKQQIAAPQRKWFFAWPIRGLVAPSRNANEDEGFDRYVNFQFRKTIYIFVCLLFFKHFQILQFSWSR